MAQRAIMHEACFQHHTLLPPPLEGGGGGQKYHQMMPPKECKIKILQVSKILLLLLCLCFVFALFVVFKKVSSEGSIYFRYDSSFNINFL